MYSGDEFYGDDVTSGIEEPTSQLGRDAQALLDDIEKSQPDWMPDQAAKALAADRAPGEYVEEWGR